MFLSSGGIKNATGSARVGGAEEEVSVAKERKVICSIGLKRLEELERFRF